MRVFIAIKPPKDIIHALAQSIQSLAAIEPQARWCQPSQLHMTMAFLGEVAPAFVPHLKEAGGALCADLTAFECHAHGFGIFGNKRSPRAIWAALDLSPELESLERTLNRGLQRFGLKPMTTEFRPHITLGRCKAKHDYRHLVRAMEQMPQPDFGTWQVQQVTLFESRVVKQGRHYQPLAQWPLQA